MKTYIIGLVLLSIFSYTLSAVDNSYLEKGFRLDCAKKNTAGPAKAADCKLTAPAYDTTVSGYYAGEVLSKCCLFSLANFRVGRYCVSMTDNNVSEFKTYPTTCTKFSGSTSTTSGTSVSNTFYVQNDRTKDSTYDTTTNIWSPTNIANSYSTLSFTTNDMCSIDCASSFLKLVLAFALMLSFLII